MTDHAELRRLAEEVIRIERNEDEPISAAWELFDSAANPKTILALLDEIDRLKSENESLRRFAAEVYQVTGALEAPENVLDNASDAANGVPLRHETLLPFFAEDYEVLRKDAARYRGLRDEGYLHNWASLHVCDEHLRAQRTDEAIDSVLNIGATQ
ncbi:ead/Ea22-like family protein [Pseudomonas aeruginosa]|uniref:ead/Ea22-like family protein n=1 Tax=Pseudomonas aeruginosa TaxID=287 RepID=UPI00283AAFB2|nr:ead/Ea22-like family protein [Pseudomonas aeruginosa]WMU52644.1 ead/Ea22-like family protein [Pseudomonas aeruginosa]